VKKKGSTVLIAPAHPHHGGDGGKDGCMTSTAARPTGRRRRWRARVIENRHAIDVDLAGDAAARKRLSPALFGLTEAVVPALRARAKGELLDAGCGTQPFRTMLEEQVDRYMALDIEARSEDVDFIGDIEDMVGVATASVDTVLCSEVLEHVPHPAKAAGELARVLKPGGALIVTVPFMARLHEEPHDYFRYTRHGLRRLLVEAGFEIDDIVETGSLFSFLGHQVSIVLLGLTWHRPVLRRLASAVNEVAVVRPAVLLDRVTRMSRLLPLGYVVTATRLAPGGRPG
jgi:SAM-dependent methyltransferase